ncbi:MAG TPA: patatin-like phospholipase family protein [Dehalococcoidia bacterium]
MPDKKLLLSIDGGGIRGILPICMLIRLEEQTGRPARETFDFVAGTSTGAVIAASIAAGIPATRMLDLYLNRAGEVFIMKPWNLLKRIVFGHMYEAEKLHDVLASEAGDSILWSLNDSPIDIMVTAKRVSDGMPWYFVRDNPRNSGRTGKLRLLDCITASAVAPTYFDPWTVPEANPPPGHKPVGRLVDGGVGVAGNPVYQACVEAFYYAEGYEPAQTVTISLGTGRIDTNEDPGKPPLAILSWIEWVVSDLLDSANEQQTDITRRHFPDMAFYRLDPDLKALDPTITHGIGQDDIAAIPKLRSLGEKFADGIDWPAILAETDARFLITPERTLMRQYRAASVAKTGE